MGQLSRALAMEGEIPWQGDVFKVAPEDNFEVMAGFELFLENRAWDNLKRQERRMSPEEYRAEREALRQDIDAGTYGFLGPVAMKARQLLLGPCLAELIYLRLRAGNPNEPKITRALVKEMLLTDADKVLDYLERMKQGEPKNSESPKDGTGQSESQPSSPTLSPTKVSPSPTSAA